MSSEAVTLGGGSAVLSFEGILVCDLIRQEINGKYLLIGVYTNAIVVQRFPANLALSFYVELAPGFSGEEAFEFQAIGPHGAQYAKLEGKVEVRDADLPGVLALPPMPFQFQAAGRLLFQHRRPDSEWKTIKSMLVETVADQQDRQRRYGIVGGA